MTTAAAAAPRVSHLVSSIESETADNHMQQQQQQQSPLVISSLLYLLLAVKVLQGLHLFFCFFFVSRGRSVAQEDEKLRAKKNTARQSTFGYKQEMRCDTMCRVGPRSMTKLLLLGGPLNLLVLLLCRPLLRWRRQYDDDDALNLEISISSSEMNEV